MQLHAQKQSAALFTVDESTNSKKSTVDDKVSDSSGRLMLMHYGEKGSITCTNKSQTVLVDFCRCTKTNVTNILLDIILSSKIFAVSGLPAHKQMRARLRQVWNPGAIHSAVVPHFYTQRRLHTEAFTHRSFLHRRFYAQTLLHTEALTHSKLSHRNTQKLFTRRRFCTQNLLHRSFSTQTLLRTEAFTHRHFYTQTLLHTDFLNTQKYHFTSVFGDETSFRSKGLRQTLENRNFTIQFLAIEPHFVRIKLVAPDAWKSQFYRIFWQLNIISCERVAPDAWKSQFYRSFWRSNFISCERVAPDPCKSQFYRSFWRSNLISCERVAFRAVSLALPRALREK